MSKLKTHKGAKKRFRKISKGTLVKHKQSFLRHTLTKKSSGRKQNLRPTKLVAQQDFKGVVRMLDGS